MIYRLNLHEFIRANDAIPIQINESLRDESRQLWTPRQMFGKHFNRERTDVDNGIDTLPID